MVCPEKQATARENAGLLTLGQGTGAALERTCGRWQRPHSVAQALALMFGEHTTLHKHLVCCLPDPHTAFLAKEPRL